MLSIESFIRHLLTYQSHLSYNTVTVRLHHVEPPSREFLSVLNSVPWRQKCGGLAFTSSESFLSFTAGLIIQCDWLSLVRGTRFNKVSESLTHNWHDSWGRSFFLLIQKGRRVMYYLLICPIRMNSIKLAWCLLLPAQENVL